ncbi:MULTISPECIES: helix-turn-helix domain-containing protein [Flavobacterium]|uniref:helix-turn-helix domain-containing protein n=1 Tax=Flavobacterium TaxID=237 RepID=UPI00188BEB99|nr:MULTISPECIES: response regulator transcription factor [Flavobacterium]MBF4470480.1 helix-turn-helix transcriptional regulator [Flavobacterium sp. HJJ]
MDNLNSNSIQKNSAGNSGVWWHEKNPGPLINIPFIKQFGSMRFTKVQMDENMRPHLNDGIEIHFVTSGKYDWVVEGNQIELLPGNLSVTAPWHWNGSPSGKMDIGYIDWIILKPLEYNQKKKLNLGNWSKLSKSIQEKLGDLIADNRNVVVEKAKTFEKYFTEIRRELANQEEGFEIMVGNILENLLIDLYRQLSSMVLKTDEETNFIEKFTKTVSDDISKKWNIDDLAHKFGMGKTKFTYEVKRLTGYPPNSYIINLKIEKAIELILNPKNKSMSDIAYSCGFSSLQHFTSSFLQRTGTTPGRYRNQEIKDN